MKIKTDILLRVRIAFIVICILGICLIGKLIHIQVFEGEKWRTIASEKLLSYKTIKATRGNIFADNGSLLATSLPFYRVALDPTIASDETYDKFKDTLAFLLANFYKDHDANYYARMINNARKGNPKTKLKPRKYIVLNRKRIGYQDKKIMSEWPIFKLGRFGGGVMFEQIDVRYQPFGSLASRTVGFINQDNAGAGLEYSFDKILAGSDGKAIFQKVSGGEIPLDDENKVKPIEGLDIETTIDINLQDLSHKALLDALESHGAVYGCAVLMEVKSGEIKAMVNLGRNKKGKYVEDYNYAMGDQGLTEPGSTFKLASMIALLENTNIKLTDSIETGNGVFKYYNAYMRDVKKGGYGKITIQNAFEYSSNVAVSKLVQEHFGKTPSNYIAAINKLGISEPVGFDILGEANPYIKTPDDKSWSGISLPWMSIGYELKLAPIQILALYNAVANGGEKIKPIIVKKIKKTDKVIDEFEAKASIHKICSQKTLQNLKILLRGVVENGTAKRINNKVYSISGKTGTTQKILNGKYIRKYSTSFVGYFPSDQPLYSCIIVIDQPEKGGQTGSSVCAPVFKEISDKVYALKFDRHKSLQTALHEAIDVPHVKPGKMDEIQQICNRLGISNFSPANSEWANPQRKEKSIMLKEHKTIQNLVPNVHNMTLKDALFLLEQNGLTVSVKGNGRIGSQSLAPGTRITKGATIELNCES